MGPRTLTHAIAHQRERFLAGAGDPVGVRPEIVESWLRCRDRYAVDPHLTSAPPAGVEPDQGLELEVVIAELSGVARSSQPDLGGAVVTVVDGAGRLITHWGDGATRDELAGANLAPWAAWAESATGTNGMGTALESDQVVRVRGAEHWCEGFQELDCVAMAVRDPVTSQALAALNITSLGASVPDTALPWLTAAVRSVTGTLDEQARSWTAHLVARFDDATSTSPWPTVAVDPRGHLVASDDRAVRLLGIRRQLPRMEVASRRPLDIPELEQVLPRAMRRGRGREGWVGAVSLSLPTVWDLQPSTITPVYAGGHGVGALVSFGPSQGEQLVDRGARQAPVRVVARQDDHTLLVAPEEIRFAEADRNTVWLHTDRGRMRAAARGLQRLERQLGDDTFIRTHRSFLVNTTRVRELERGHNGELLLATDAGRGARIPVARARVAWVRRRLGS